MAVKRQPRGVRTGGQFATGTRSDDVDLDPTGPSLTESLRDDGVPFLIGDQCPDTFYLGQSASNIPRAFSKESSGCNKPPGLWTAPARSTPRGLKTAWTDYLSRQGNPVSGQLYRIKAAPDAVIIRLHTADDLEAFGRRYPRFALRGHDHRLAAWRDVEADGVGAVMITEHGVSAAKHVVYRDPEHPACDVADAVSDWDVSSVCWLRPGAVRFAGPADRADYRPDPDSREDDLYDRYLTYEDDEDDLDETIDTGTPSQDND